MSNKKSTEPKETVLSIKFANEAAANHFALWLCEAGEQDYWQWMEYREKEEKGDITATVFDYHGEKGEDEFVTDNTIRTIVSRLDKEE